MKREDEARLFRFTLRHSVFLASVIGLIVLFYAYVAPGLAPKQRCLVSPIRETMKALKIFALILIPMAAFAQPKPPEQPIPYSHKQHIANGLTCKDCHTVVQSSPDAGDEMAIPAASKCMTCHRTIKKDSPAIQKLAAYDRDKQPIPWVRIYKLPDFVFFSHQTHLKAGAQCEECHGQVAAARSAFPRSHPVDGHLCRLPS